MGSTFLIPFELNLKLNIAEKVQKHRVKLDQRDFCCYDLEKAVHTNLQGGISL